MSYLTLNEVKDHLSISYANTDHDARLERLITAAEEWAANFLNSSLENYESSPPESPPVIPEQIKSGMLLHLEIDFDRDEKKLELLDVRSRELLWPYRVELGV